jgi:hypothetical protein
LDVQLFGLLDGLVDGPENFGQIKGGWEKTKYWNERWAGLA